MPSSISISKSVSGLGKSLGQQINRTAETGSTVGVDLPVAPPGELTTRTDDAEGTVTMDDAGHGITTGQNVDLYWDGGVQYDVTVGTVSGTAVPFSGGSGDNLPSTETPIVVAPRVPVSAEVILTAGLVYLAVRMHHPANLSSTARGHIQLLDDTTEVYETLLAPREVKDFDVFGGAPNPLGEDDVNVIMASQSSTTNPGHLDLLWLQDAAPE